jgi:rhamnose utilization protein RhaD (predicted bifunctional aldolase and dehydrogenase)/NAD(P)-dependent dehydrogenase (short-subunit alcohol dehydrogenase family)
MRNLYSEHEAATWVAQHPGIPEALALRVYTSRLIGKDPALVLHGGGNASVKCRHLTVAGDDIEALFVKGSGTDLATVTPEAFCGLELASLRKLRSLESLDDEEIENQLGIHRLWAKSPDPSVEALVHAFLPHAYVDHTHADSILVLTHQERGEKVLRDALGPKAAVIPYAMPGFLLAKAVIAAYDANQEIDAVVAMDHGIFTFAEDSETSYARMIEYVSRAEAFIEERLKDKSPFPSGLHGRRPSDPDPAVARCAPAIRGACSFCEPSAPRRRFYVEARTSSALLDASLTPFAEYLCESGVLTPDHAIRTKNRMVFLDFLPERNEELKHIIDQKVGDFTAKYRLYFHDQGGTRNFSGVMLDPYPRLFLVAGVGLLAVGFTRKEARVNADIGEHTILAKAHAMALGGYVPVPEQHAFDMEYWPLQQKKLPKPGSSLLEGQIAVITGGAGAIGFGIARQLLKAGAFVALTDIHQTRLENVLSLLRQEHEEERIEGLALDVTDYASVEKGFREICRRIGGIDLLVPNAGMAHVARLEDLEPARLDEALAVNVKGTFTVIKAAIPIFKRQGTGGNIVVISSKNVFDPGPAFGAYSASKAGAHQLSKIAAMELADVGVRVNMINPDAVFGDEKVSSGLWDLVGPERMKSRGLDPEGLKAYYRERSLLKKEVLAEHVGNAVVFFASDLTPTTGATLPVDGGIPGAFPR